MLARKIRVGVIGSVWGERAHVPSIRALPEMELGAVCTAHPETAKAMAERTGAPKAYSDISQLIADPEIDLVTISTRVALHHPFAKMALEAGKHVYVEWPLGVNTAQGEDLVDLARRQRRVAGLGLQGRWSPVNMYMRQLIKDGYIGDTLSFSLNSFAPQYIQPTTTQRWWLPIKEEGGSALTIAGGHGMDSMFSSLGYPAEVAGSVDVRLKQWTWSDTEETVQVTAPDTVAVAMRLQSGAVGTVTVSRVAWHGSGLRLEVYGLKGALRVEPTGALWGGKGGGSFEEIKVPDEFHFTPEVPRTAQHYAVAQAFRKVAQAIRGAAGLEPDLSTGVRLHRVIATIEQSSQDSRWVKVPA